MKIIIIQAIAICVLLAAFIRFNNRLQTVKDERDEAIEFSLAKSDSIKYFTTALGQAAAKADVLELTNANLRRLQHDKDLAWIKQFESVNRRLNNIEQATRTTAVATGDFEIKFDTTSNIIRFLQDSALLMSNGTHWQSGMMNPPQAPCPDRTFDNENEWFRLTGKVTADAIQITPLVPITLEEVIVWERRHKFLGIRFGKKVFSSQITTPNPYVTITAHQVIRVRKK